MSIQISNDHRMHLEYEIQNIVLDIFNADQHEVSHISGCVVNLLMNEGIIDVDWPESQAQEAEEDTSMAEGS